MGFFHGKKAKKWLSSDFGVEKWNFLKSYKTSPGTSGGYSKAFLRCFRTCRTSNLEIFGRVILRQKLWKKPSDTGLGSKTHFLWIINFWSRGPHQVSSNIFCSFWDSKDCKNDLNHQMSSKPHRDPLHAITQSRKSNYSLAERVKTEEML